MNKAPGIEFVGTSMLLELSPIISQYVADLYRHKKSLSTGDVPYYWKVANVTAVFLRKVQNQVPRITDPLA